MSELKIQRNIRVYYAYLGLFQLIVGPILTLYLLDKGLNYTEIMTLQSFFSVAVVVLKNLAVAAAFPVAGFFMDRIDAVQINLLSGLLMALGTIFFWFYLNRRIKRADSSACSAADRAGLG